MLSSINPLGERGRNSRYALTVVAYVIASVAGGLVTGSGLGALGQGLAAITHPTPTTVAWLVLAIAVIGVAVDLRLGGLKLPSYQRQVNEDWLTRYRGWVYGAGFGFQLGLGLVTIVPTAGIYAIFLLAVLSGSMAGGAVIGLTFGLVRSLMILLSAGARTPESLRASHRRVTATGAIAQRVVVAAQGGTAALMLGVLLWH